MPKRWVDAAVALLRQLPGHASKVIAIDGHSAAGKSTFTAELADRLSAAVVPADDFYRVMPEEQRAKLSPRAGVDLYYDWPRMRREALEPLRTRTAATYRPYDWGTGEVDGAAVTIEPADVVIVEGLFVSRPELADLVDLAVLVEAPAQIRARRQHQRADATEEWLSRWEAAEQAFFREVRGRESYDLVVAGHGPIAMPAAAEVGVSDGPAGLPQFLLVLRGPAAAGKSTLARGIRDRLGYPTAVIDTDLFAWEIVPAESNLPVRYHGVRLLAEHYLRSGYSVVVSGLIFTFEDQGVMGALKQFTESRGLTYVDAFCKVSLDTATDRNRRRPKGQEIAIPTITTWWTEAIDDLGRVPWPVVTLDLEQPLDDVVDEVLQAVARDAGPSC